MLLLLTLFILIWIILLIISITISFWPGKLNYLNEFKFCNSRFTVYFCCPLDSYTQIVRSICMDELWIRYSKEMFGVNGFCYIGIWEGHRIWRGAKQEKEQWNHGCWKVHQLTQISYRSFSLTNSSDLSWKVLGSSSHTHCPGDLPRNLPGSSIVVDLTLIFFLKIQHSCTILLSKIINYFSRFY